MEGERKIVYHLLSLPYCQIIEIAVELNLLRNKDKKGGDELELVKRIFNRAKEMGILDQLQDAVERKRVMVK